MSSLKHFAIKSCFNTLSIPEKRELALQLLEDAEHVNKVETSPVEKSFRDWLDKDEHLYDEPEIERLWFIWNFLKNYSISGHYAKTDSEVESAFVYPYCQDSDMRQTGRGFKEYIPTSDSRRDISRNEFFDWILTNLNPNQLSIEMRDQDDRNDYEYVYLQFLITDPRLTINHLLEIKWHQLSYDDSDAEKTEQFLDSNYHDVPVVPRIKKQKTDVD